MKKRLLCPMLPQPGKMVLLSEGEAHHSTRVLRLVDGDRVEAIDGKGHRIIAILRLRGGPARLEYEAAVDSGNTVSQKDAPPIVLEMSVLKGQAMEWVIEKAVELGVSSFIPVLTDHTVVQMKSKTPDLFQQRWQKIADQALKQCGRLEAMKVTLPTP